MKSFVDFLRLIKFTHTLFALPFALAAYVLALADDGSISDNFKPLVLFWVLMAMVGMRSAAMSFNRLLDAGIDAKNPRTKDREIPAGVISKATVLTYLLLFSALYFLACFQINELAFQLSLIPYLVCLFYSFCKRFTSLCHLVLGVALGLSPIGAWVAVTGKIEQIPVLMGVAVMFWTAGFDILYACMDIDFDKKEGLHSIPARFGLKGALNIARFLHLCMLGIWAWMIHYAQFQWPFWSALGLIMILVVIQHLMVKIDDLKRMNLVFFKLNVGISLIILLGALVEVNV